MDRKSTHLLRNGPEKIEPPNRNDPLEFDTFLNEWRRLLKNEGGAWDGARVVAELKAKGVVKFLLCEEQPEGAWQAHDLFDRVLDEMKAYRAEATARRIKEYFEDVDEFLESEMKRIQKREDRARIPELKSLLQDLEKTVERTRRTLNWLKKRKQEWQFGAWKRFWPEIPRKNLVESKIDLDMRLQAEMGKMLADYLVPEGVSLETIARLILLAYCAGELAEIKDGDPKTKFGDRTLRVRNIRDILRARGIARKERNFKGQRASRIGQKRRRC